LHHFTYKKNRLHCEDVPVAKIAEAVGTPFYLYSQSTLERHFRVFDSAFAAAPHLTCYAVKANSNLAILRLLHRMGAGFDIVSGGELQRVLKAGGEAGKTLFSGAGKSLDEIDLAISHDILQFNVESAAELDMIEARARSAGRTARIGLRVNPNVDAETHPYISTGLRQHKFGIQIEEAPDLYRKARSSRRLRVTGVGFHIGSQITRVEPFVDALQRLRELVLALRAEGIEIRRLDLGGGLGITYNDEAPPAPADYAQAIIDAVEGLGCILMLEPGRVIVGNAGILVTRVLLTKRNEGKNFVIVDAGMSELLRPSLYGSYHGIQPERLKERQSWTADIVGPICESGDFIARDRLMPVVHANELLAVMSAGAYGFVLSSNYNSRPRAPEVLVRNDRFKVIRRRENFKDVIRGESPRPL
jgi:diaminopimelate decarboxylase